MGTNKGLSIRALIISGLALLFVVGVGYKIFEWQTINDISNAYNSSWFNELKFVSQSSPASDDYFNELTTNKQFKTPKDSSDYLIGLGTVESKLDVLINDNEGYADLIKKDQTTFQLLNNRTNLLFGERGDMAKRIVNDQLAYYQDETKRNNIILAEDYGTKILFTDYRDGVALTDFLKGVGSSTNPATVIKYFGGITSLEKYTNSDFKFEHEDMVNNYFPNFISKINNIKKFYSAYYIAEKDFTVGNTDTGQLDLQAVTDAGASSYIDYSSIFDEQTSNDAELLKDTLKIVSDQSSAIKVYKTKQLYKYPLLKNVDIWNEDLVLCQMYNFKTGIYKFITSNYPVSKNVPDLIKELSSISPKTDNVDSSFDQSTMTFTNLDKKLEFTCKNKTNKEVLNFSIVK